MSLIIIGKALLVIESGGPEYSPSVHAFIQSATGGEYAHSCAHEDLPMLVELHELPDLKPFKKMPEGEVLRVAISFTLVYTRDYWGECDVDLEVNKMRVLRRQKPRKERYVSKKDRK